MKRFSPEVSAKLRNYVYVLVDPRNEQVFYVGKGHGSMRPFQHLKPENGPRHSDKYVKTLELRHLGIEPRIDIVRYDLDSETAMEVEAAVIDTLGLENLANQNLGRASISKGRMTAVQLEKRL